jgi:poly(A) polymerase
LNSFDIATRLIRILQEAGFIAYTAGGFVRDFLLNHPSNDIDIATDANVEDIQRLFDKTIPVGIQFGIIIVVLDGHHFEVATFRKEEGHHDGRRPTQIFKTTAKEDALRRDFTINGMFYDPISEEFFDYVEGKQDLEQKVIRAIGDPHERFLEDRLRMIRAARYAARFSFAIDADTIEAILRHAQDLFPAVAIERVYDELKKMAQNQSTFYHAIELLHRLRLLEQIFKSLKGVAQSEIHRRLKPIHQFKTNAAILMVMQLFYDQDLEQQKQILDYLKVSGQEKDLIIHLHHCKKIDSMNDFELCHLFAHKSTLTCLEIICANKGQMQKMQEYNQKQDNLKQWIVRIKTQNPVIKAKDLMNLGIEPSKKMGELLQKAEQISILEKTDDPKVILKKLATLANHSF